MGRFKSDKKIEHNIHVVNILPKEKYSAIIIAVAHNNFKKIDLKKLKLSNDSIIYDVKGILKEFTHRL